MRRIVVLILTLLTLSGCQTAQPEKTTTAADIMTYAKQHMVVKDEAAWQDALDETHGGRNVKTARELSTALNAANPHSWAVADGKDIEDIHYPTVTTASGLRMINIPAFYSNHRKPARRYVTTLQRLVRETPAGTPIILNLAHSQGGDPLVMFAGLSRLIPNGPLWYEIDRNGKQRSVARMAPNKVSLSREGTSEAVPTTAKDTGRAVYVITDNQSLSAAETVVLALKRNPAVKTVGYPTGGLTSANVNLPFGRDNKATAVVTVASLKAVQPVGGQTAFNNTPIPPDIKTLYSPINWAKDRPADQQQPLDPDFIAELRQVVGQ